MFALGNAPEDRREKDAGSADEPTPAKPPNGEPSAGVLRVGDPKDERREGLCDAVCEGDASASSAEVEPTEERRDSRSGNGGCGLGDKISIDVDEAEADCPSSG